jgi:hypothetical protein
MNATFMPRLTASAARVTTRKHFLTAVAALGLLAFTGCSTPGPNHAYVVATADASILDFSKGKPTTEVPSYLSSAYNLYGLAYDPFTDHLFLRIVPGNFVRVIDRPARAIKYDFTAEGVPDGAGDLAIRSSDRHLFFAHPTEPILVETSLVGKHVRDIRLQGFTGAPSGVAYDQKLNHFFILSGGDLDQVTTYSLDGKRLGAISLDRTVQLASLAFDSVTREFYVPLRDQSAIGIFNLKGLLVRSLPIPATESHPRVDVGERSLIRLF